MSRDSLVFLVRFALSLAGFFALSRWDLFISRVREPYCEALATSVAAIFNTLGIQTHANGSSLLPVQGVGGITIVPECDGIVLLALFGAGVLAVPFARTARPWLLALAGVVLLVVLNWLRLAALAYTSFYHPAIFDSMHHYFMQGLLMIAVLALYVGWLRQLEPPEPRIEEGTPA